MNGNAEYESQFFGASLSSAFGTTVTSGGADAFLEILEEEIIPWVEARVFMSAGSLEGMMVPDMLRLAETLKTRAYEDLQIETQVLDGESHLSGAFLSLSRAFGSLFRPR